MTQEIFMEKMKMYTFCYSTYEGNYKVIKTLNNLKVTYI